MDRLSQSRSSLSGLELPLHLGVLQPSAWFMEPKLMEVMWLRKDYRQAFA